MRRLAALFVVTLLSACGVRPLITNHVTVEFPDDKSLVRVNAATIISDEPAPTPQMEQRVSAMRDALANQRDEWSIRYAGLHPEYERLVVDRHRGAIQRVERFVTIPRDELGRFFDDTAISVAWTGGGGMSEVVVMPRGSTRATREQRAHVMALLNNFSIDAAAYVKALSDLYSWLDAHPQQAQFAYARILDESAERSTSEELQTLIEGVQLTSHRITARLDAERDEQFTVDEQFDLVFNPFSSEVTVKVPKRTTLVENFVPDGENTLTIPHAGLLDAVKSLDGRWVAPDPLAMSLRGEVTVSDLMAVPRKHSLVVTPSEIQNAIVEKLRPASVYRVRWLE